MYQKYTTEALVLGSRELGEADRMVTLLTREFGLIRARAVSARAEKSRMRYAIQGFSRAHVSLVRGSRGWRLAGAAALAVPAGSAGAAAFARIAELAERLVGPDEANAYLFDALKEAHLILMNSPENHGTVEIVCVARMLFSLGYISNEALGSAILTHTAYSIDHLAEAESMRERLLASINRAIAEAQL